MRRLGCGDNPHSSQDGQNWKRVSKVLYDQRMRVKGKVYKTGKTSNAIHH